MENSCCEPYISLLCCCRWRGQFANSKRLDPRPIFHRLSEVDGFQRWADAKQRGSTTCSWSVRVPCAPLPSTLDDIRYTNARFTWSCSNVPNIGPCSDVIKAAGWPCGKRHMNIGKPRPDTAPSRPPDATFTDIKPEDRYSLTLGQQGHALSLNTTAGNFPVAYPEAERVRTFAHSGLRRRTACRTSCRNKADLASASAQSSNASQHRRRRRCRPIPLTEPYRTASIYGYCKIYPPLITGTTQMSFRLLSV